MSTKIIESTVEEAALSWFAELGYSILAGPKIAPGELLSEREAFSEVILTKRVQAALYSLNPNIPTEAIDDALRKITHFEALSFIANNRTFHRMLVDGIAVEYRQPSSYAPSPQPSPRGRGSQEDDGRIQYDMVRLIDFDNPDANDWLAVNQFAVVEGQQNRRPDVIVFVNGLPLATIELKNAAGEDATAYNAFKDIQTYKLQIPSLFVNNEVLVVSDGLEARAGTISTDWERFMPWRTIEGEELASPVMPQLEVLMRGMFDKRRFLDLLRYFIVFEEDESGELIKKMAGYHQFHAVNKAVEAMLRAVGVQPTLHTLTPNPSLRGRGEKEVGERSSMLSGPLPGPLPEGEGERNLDSADTSGTPPSPRPSPKGRGSNARQYRGGYQFAGLVELARELRKKQTPAEALLWEMLRNRRLLGFKFRRQHQFGDYIADFYCHEAKLVIECDGAAHEPNEQWHHDQERDAYLIAQGLWVLRFSNEQIVNDTENVLEKIAAYLPSPPGRRAGEEGAQPERATDEVTDDFPSPTGRGAGGEGAAHGRLGVFWHTQGSGKSFSMVFFSQKILRKLPGNWTFVIVTDRDDLDDQIYKNFVRCGAVTEPEKTVRAQSSEHLKQLLSENHRYVFTLIQKFRTERGQIHPMVSDRPDIIVITDEAHRSQYDQLALNMRNALPNAAFIGFTGTPLMAGEERTKEVFGDYVSIYNFKQSVDDHATVPLFYENRIPELQLVNENLNDEMAELIEDAGLSEDQEKKLEREFSREYHLITRDERLERIAEDIVKQFVGRGFQGKAMVISIDKATAVRMYNKVQKYWNLHLEKLVSKLARWDKAERSELEDKIKFMRETDMAVVVSQSQNEVEELAARGADIVPHRRRMNKEDLDEKFKDDKDPLRIAFVCAMWITGFDVESCSTIYLDKPMKNHTLMQTIARANRVFPDKVNGLIVDYVGVFRNLEKALAIYAGSPSGLTAGETPVKDKESLVALLRGAIGDVTKFCKDHGVDPHSIAFAPGFGRVKLIDDAVEAIIVNDESKRRYLTLESSVSKLYKAILPDFLANQFYPTCALFRTIADKIRAEAPEIDISEVMTGVDELLDHSIAAEGYVIHEAARMVDLSKIDFDALQKRFAKGRKRIEAERLKTSLSVKLAEMILRNKTRMDFLEKFQEMIDEYNSGAINVEVFFAKLVEFTQDLNEEERRTIAEQLSEEELAVFDLLTKPKMALTKKETEQVKKIARELLVVLKREKLVLDWRAKQQARAGVQLAIQDSLEGLPRSYSRPLYAQKCELIYQHVYDSYFGSGQSVYSKAA